MIGRPQDGDDPKCPCVEAVFSNVILKISHYMHFRNLFQSVGETIVAHNLHISEASNAGCNCKFFSVQIITITDEVLLMADCQTVFTN